MAGTRVGTQHTDCAVEFPEDVARRPAVQGPHAAAAEGARGCRHVADADQVHRRGTAGADQGADGRRAHRTGVAHGPRLDRRPDRRSTGRGRARLTARLHDRRAEIDYLGHATPYFDEPAPDPGRVDGLRARGRATKYRAVAEAELAAVPRTLN